MHKVAVVLGIRPDFIRTSIVLRLLKEHPNVEATFLHTGQHYDHNLSDIFFDELGVPRPDIQLQTRADSHFGQHSQLIMQLGQELEKLQPDVCLFLGDANATIGCVAPLKMGIPIAHIEAGMRSFNWKMPEERNRVLIDRVSDILYVYQHDYKINLVREGVEPTRIEVVGNVIVDVVNEHRDKLDWMHKGIAPLPCKPGEYALMTLHRNEHVEIKGMAEGIIRTVGETTKKLGIPVILIEMPRLKKLGIKYPQHFHTMPPLGFFDFIRLEANAMIEYTDSGTNQEVSALLGTPCVVTREATERPETFKSGITFMSSPYSSAIEEATELALTGTLNEDFTLGDGKSSERIVENLVKRLDGKRRYFNRVELGSSIPILDPFILEHFNVVRPGRSKENPYALSDIREMLG